MKKPISVGIYFHKEGDVAHLAMAVFGWDRCDLMEPIRHLALDSRTPTQVADTVGQWLRDVFLTYKDQIGIVRHRTRVNGFTPREIIRTAGGRRPNPHGTAEVTESVALSIEEACRSDGLTCKSVREPRKREFLQSVNSLFDARGLATQNRHERNAILVAIGLTRGRLHVVARAWVTKELRSEFKVAKRAAVAARLAELGF